VAQLGATADPVSLLTAAAQVMHFLNELYTVFDDLVDMHDLYKLDTVVSGPQLRCSEGPAGGPRLVAVAHSWAWPGS
jgi:hypothetical protein